MDSLKKAGNLTSRYNKANLMEVEFWQNKKNGECKA